LLVVIAAEAAKLLICSILMYLLCVVQTVGWKSVAGEEVYWADVDRTTLQWKCKASDFYRSVTL